MFGSVQWNGTLHKLQDRYIAELSNEFDTFLSCCIIDIKCLFDLRLLNFAFRIPGSRISPIISLSFNFFADLAGQPFFVFLRFSFFNFTTDLASLPFFVFLDFDL